MASQDNSRRRWSDAENALFLQGLEALGRTQWRRIASEFVRTRSAEQVRSKVQKHFKTPPRPREEEAAPRRSLGDLPDVLLAGALDYSDLGEVAACAAASIQLRDGLRRVAPALQRRFVFRRFPMLATITAAEEPPPRELFLSQTRLFAERPALAPIGRAFDDYVFTIELELKFFRRSDQGDLTTTSRESIFVGKGEVIGGELHAQVSFDIPKDVFNRAFDFNNWWMQPRKDPSLISEPLFLRVMVSKGFSRARLGQGACDDYDVEEPDMRQMRFYNLGLGAWRHGEKGGLDWLRNQQLGADSFHLPTVEAAWFTSDSRPASKFAGQSTLVLDFQWCHFESDDGMTREDAAEALEHYATWT